MKCFALCMLIAFGPAALNAQSPWARVPALPTGCYSTPDSNWFTAVTKAREALQAEIARQDATNSDAEKKLTDMDPGAQAAAMQAAMMKDPQGAMKVLQAIQTTGTEAGQTERVALLEREREITGRFATLETEYRAALKQATAPSLAAMTKLTGDGSAADIAATQALQKQYDAAYAKVCAQWFQAAGAFSKWLASYKDFFVTEYIPFEERSFIVKKDMFTFYGVDTQNYRPTTPLSAVSKYLNEAYRVYNLRQVSPNYR